MAEGNQEGLRIESIGTGGRVIKKRVDLKTGQEVEKVVEATIEDGKGNPVKIIVTTGPDVIPPSRDPRINPLAPKRPTNPEDDSPQSSK